MSKKLKSYRFDEKTINLIDELRESMGLENNSDVLRRSLALLKIANNAQIQDEKLIVKSKSGDREIILI